MKAVVEVTSDFNAVWFGFHLPIDMLLPLDPEGLLLHLDTFFEPPFSQLVRALPAVFLKYLPDIVFCLGTTL